MDLISSHIDLNRTLVGPDKVSYGPKSPLVDLIRSYGPKSPLVDLIRSPMDPKVPSST